MHQLFLVWFHILEQNLEFRRLAKFKIFWFDTCKDPPQITVWKRAHMEIFKVRHSYDTIVERIDLNRSTLFCCRLIWLQTPLCSRYSLPLQSWLGGGGWWSQRHGSKTTWASLYSCFLSVHKISTKNLMFGPNFVNIKNIMGCKKICFCIGFLLFRPRVYWQVFVSHFVLSDRCIVYGFKQRKL